MIAEMKIYFAGSIRGGRDDAVLYHRIVTLLAQYGEVLTEHVGDTRLPGDGEEGCSDGAIFERDTGWLAQADVVVAEATMPSHGVGYEIARAEALGKPVLCLYRPAASRRLSAMLAGNPAVRCEAYGGVGDLKPILEEFFQEAR